VWSGARGLVKRLALGLSALTGLIGWCGKGVTTLTGGVGDGHGWRAQLVDFTCAMGLTP
jgi:hypothetical protein